MQILNLISIVLLLCITYQDFKSKEISWLLIPFLCIVFLINGLYYVAGYKLLKYFLINIAFLSFQLIILLIYFSLKKKKIENIINKYIGLGDILFLLTLCLFFEPYYFIIFQVLGFIIILFIYGVYFLITNKTVKYIPLAGGLALFLGLLILIKLFIVDINFYNRQIFEKFLFYINGVS